MEKFYSFLELCAGTVLLKSYSGREFLCRHGTKIWSIAHASICDYIYCNLINVHKQFCFFFAKLCDEKANAFWLCQSETRDISNVKEIYWRELFCSLCGCMLDLWKCLKTFCIRAMCMHAWGYLIRFNLVIY